MKCCHKKEEEEEGEKKIMQNWLHFKCNNFICDTITHR